MTLKGVDDAALWKRTGSIVLGTGGAVLEIIGTGVTTDPRVSTTRVWIGGKEAELNNYR